MGSSIESGLTIGTLAGYLAALLLIAALASGRLTMIRLGAVAAGLLWLVQAMFVSGDGMAAAFPPRWRGLRAPNSPAPGAPIAARG